MSQVILLIKLSDDSGVIIKFYDENRYEIIYFIDQINENNNYYILLDDYNIVIKGMNKNE